MAEAEPSSPLDCPVCSEEFTDPKLLDCNHVICSKCLVDWLRKTGKDAGCPLCRAAILSPSLSDHDDLQSLVDALPTDQAMVAKVENAQMLGSHHVCMMCDNNTAAVAFCLQCNMKLCRGCAKGHTRSPYLKSHLVEELDNMTEERLVEVNRARCKTHDDRPAELYCDNHQKLICMLCVTSDHSDCSEVKVIKDAGTEKREKFRRQAAELRKREKTMRTQIKKMKDSLTDMRADVNKVCDDLRLSVENRRQAMHEVIRTEEERAGLSQADQVRAATLSLAGVLDDRVQSAPDDALLDMESAIMSRLGHLEEQASVTDRMPLPADVRFDPHQVAQLKSAIAALDHMQNPPGNGKDGQGSDWISISIPSSFLENVNLFKVLGGVDFHMTVKGGMTNIAVGFEELLMTAGKLDDAVRSKVTSESAGGWSNTLDAQRVEASRFDLKENQGTGRRMVHTASSGQQQKSVARSQGFTAQAQATNCQVETYKTLSGITVLVYKIDITKLPLDAIVNAANEDLSHGGGVALAISRAAGFVLDDEGREHIRKHGQLRVTEVVETSPGNLPCQKVLHAVGPRWGKYRDKAQCRQHLVDTVFNCLRKADSLGFTSVALPPVSSAIFGVPQDVCAESYLSAVKTFDSLHARTTSLKHIHFVDVSDTMIAIIQTIFSALWGAPVGITPGVPSTAGDTGRGQKTAVENLQKPQGNQLGSKGHAGLATRGQLPGTGGQSRDQCDDFPVKITFEGENLSVLFQKQSAVDAGTDAVILWQDVQNVLNDSTWKQFEKTLNPMALVGVKECQKDMSIAGEVVCCSAMYKQFVFVTLSPRVSYSEDNITEFLEQAFNEVDHGKKRTVTVTKLQKRDTDIYSMFLDMFKNPGQKQNTRMFIGSLYRAVKAYTKRFTRSITEIHVVDTDPAVLQSMMNNMTTLIRADHAQLYQASPKLFSVPAKAHSHPDHCDICLGKLVGPKALPCGHVFCRSCIDRWFQSQPTCPSCCTVHGVMFGDQPGGGTMKMTFTPYRMCPGFIEGRGTYMVDYSFPSGIQTDNHPSPGKRYNGMKRRAYLPDTREGRTVLMLFKVAFDRRLIFTVGQSATTGQEGIVWSGIHHKTETTGGPASYGYPDPKYLGRVQMELAARGVTESDLTDVQQDFIKNPDSLLPSACYKEFSELFNRR